MDIYQQIAELGEELTNTCLTAGERRAAIRELHELQHDLDMEEIEAIDRGDGATAAILLAQWSRIECALAA